MEAGTQQQQQQQQQTANGTSGSAEVQPAEKRATRYVILYRVEGDPEHTFRTLLLPPEGDQPMQRAVVEGFGQGDARARFREACEAEERPITYPGVEQLAQIAAVPFSSWDPKAPRVKTTVAWE